MYFFAKNVIWDKDASVLLLCYHHWPSLRDLQKLTSYINWAIAMKFLYNRLNNINFFDKLASLAKFKVLNQVQYLNMKIKVYSCLKILGSASKGCQ
jgi:hypothetical protein